MKKAILPLSADPFTFGHLHLLQLALKKFDFIYLVISNDVNKKYLLKREQRVFLTKKIIEEDESFEDKVEVISYDGLIAHLAIQKEVTFLVRGYRNALDLEYEKSMSFYNQNIFSSLQTVYIQSKPKYRFISSTAVKILLENCGEIYTYVPIVVKKFLEQQKNIYRIGVTGSIACGKTIFCKVAAKQKILGKKIYHINFDEIVAKIYQDIGKNQYPILQEKVKKICDFKIKNVTKKEVSNFLFDKVTNSTKRKKKLLILQKSLAPLIQYYSFQKIKDKKGIILYDAPLLAEYGMSAVVNKDIVLVTSKKQIEILQERDKISLSQAKQKIIANSEQKKKEMLKKDNCNIFVFENNADKNNLSKKVKSFLEEVIQKNKGEFIKLKPKIQLKTKLKT